MNKFRTFDQILNFDPKDHFENINQKYRDWDYSQTPTLNDIKIWEEIYYSHGGVSVYAAYDPYVEYYIIVHEILKNNLNIGIEKFYGIGAAKNIEQRLKEFDIVLPSRTVWVNVHNMPEAN